MLRSTRIVLLLLIVAASAAIIPLMHFATVLEREPQARSQQARMLPASLRSLHHRKVPCCDIYSLDESTALATATFAPDYGDASCRPAPRNPPASDGFDEALARALDGTAPTCDASPSATTTTTPPFFPWEFGFGSMMHSFVKVAWDAMDRNVPLVVRDRLLFYQNRSRCEAMSLWCFFAPVGDCPPPPPYDVNEITAFRDGVMRNYSGRDGPGPASQAAATARLGLGPRLARLLSVGRTIHRLLRPSGRIEAMARAAAAEAGWDFGQETRVLGLHVRHGDACSRRERRLKKRSCDPLSAYMPQVYALAARYGIRHVFLATDSPDVVAEALRDYSHNLTWHYLRNPQRRGVRKRKIETQLQRGEIDGFLEGAYYLVDALLLAQTDVLVGKFTSNLLRIALELQVGRDRCVRPFASLDGSEWCFDFTPFPEDDKYKFAGRVLMKGQVERFSC